MKKLIVALILLTPFMGVSQDSKDSLWKSLQYNGGSSVHPSNAYIITTRDGWIIGSKPDTLSAYLLVTTRHMGIAYQRRGFVVRQYGKEDVYLDCDKKVLKAPFNVWQFRLINQPK